MQNQVVLLINTSHKVTQVPTLYGYIVLKKAEAPPGLAM